LSSFKKVKLNCLRGNSKQNVWSYYSAKICEPDGWIDGWMDEWMDGWMGGLKFLFL
jgi:hypothetical protein